LVVRISRCVGSVEYVGSSICSASVGCGVQCVGAHIEHFTQNTIVVCFIDIVVAGATTSITCVVLSKAIVVVTIGVVGVPGAGVEAAVLLEDGDVHAVADLYSKDV